MVMFVSFSFTTGAISRRRSSMARALRTASWLNRSCSVTTGTVLIAKSLRQIFNFQRIAVTDDPAGSGFAEMTADDQHVLIAEALHEIHARLAARLLVHVEARGAATDR